MVSVKSIATAIILLQISMGVINLTGIFPVQEELTDVDFEEIEAKKANITLASTNKDSVLDYFNVLGKMVNLGFELLGTFLDMVFGAIPNILKLFMIPEGIANLIGNAANALVILAICWKLFMRGG